MNLLCYKLLENSRSGMVGLKKNCFKHKIEVRSKTLVAKYNKLNLTSIPLVAQVNLKKILNQLVFSAILKPPTNVSVGTLLMDSPRLSK